MQEDSLVFHAATPGRWADVDALFASCGDARQCWCAFWYRSHKAFQAGKGADNRRFLEALIKDGKAPGVIAYRGEAAVGWCGIAPRTAQDRLSRSRVLAPVDDAEVWSITCFVIARPQRRQGLMRPLIEAAVAHGAAAGATMIEAYPLDAQRKIYPGELYVGTVDAFRDCGFHEVARRSPTRPIMRRTVAAG